MLLQAGLDFLNNCILELKWKPPEDATSSEEEPPKKPSPDEINLLRSIVINFALSDRDWMQELFVSNRDIWLKWIGSQEKSKQEEVMELFVSKGDNSLDKAIDEKAKKDDLKVAIESASEETLLDLVLALRPIIIRFDEESEAKEDEA